MQGSRKKTIFSIKFPVMTRNKQTVQQYMDTYAASDDAGVAACLTDDVIWEMPGFFHLTGKEAFLKEMHNPMSTGNTHINVTRMIEENGVVSAEGTVRSEKTEGGWLEGVFCDIFEMENGKIKKLISYFMMTDPLK